MGKMRSPLVMQELTLPRGITFVFNPTMGSSKDEGIENLETDLLVLTQMESAHMSTGCRKIDALLGGIIEAQIKESGFKGSSGQHLLIDLSKSPAARQKYILLVGLGDYRRFNGRSVCALTFLILDTASKLKVQKLTLPIFPGRQSEGNINLAGTAAIIACRVQTFASRLPELQTFEFFCTSQARKHLQDGLMAKIPHCMICSNPELKQD